MYEITNEDLKLVLQQSASPQTPKLILDVLNSNGKVISTINTIISATLNINSDSDIRRSGNFTVQPTLKEHIKLHPDDLIWLNRYLRFKVGIYNIREQRYKYYTLAYFVYNDSSSTYDSVTNQLSFSCSDFIVKLNGTKNGQIGSLITKFPAYEESNDDTIKYNTIRNAIIAVLEELGGIKNYRIEDIGEYKALPDYNDNWEKYRTEHETWNAIPYDEEFSCGCSILSILTTFRDLYPNYEMFFDPSDDNRFICQMTPFCYEDDIILDNAFLQRVLISENTSIDLSTVRNICEVWGKTIDTEFYTENCTYSNNIYSCIVDGFDTKYYHNDTISIKIPLTNQKNPKLNINNLGLLDIYDESNDSPISAGIISSNSIYSFKIKKVKIENEYIFRAYLLGQWQAHAIDVLSSKAVKNQADIYSEEYFKNKYNCNTVNITIIPNSPFTVQNLGEILDVKTGGEYENITSDSLALDRAIYENWKNCRLTDQITITTLLLPFLDVNIKVSYKPKNSDIERQYVIKSVSHDFAGYTSTITMYRFYPTYKSLLKEAGTHKTLSSYIHGVLGKYAHEELPQVLSEEDL